MAAAKKRSKSMSAYEQESLLSIIDKHKSVIENKKNDATMISKKKKSWLEIESEFCALPRDHASLKKFWENLKCKAKKSITKEKKGKENDWRWKTGSTGRSNQFHGSIYNT